MGEPIKFPNLLQIAVVGATGLAAGFSASRHLAEICDQIQPELNFAARVAQGQTVAALIHTLPPDLYQKLESRFGAKMLSELVSLEKECDRELFFSGLLSMAGRLAQQEAGESLALGLYHRIETSSKIVSIGAMAGKQRLLLEGKGNFGAQTETFFRHLGQQMGDYRTMVAMFGGAMVGAGLYNVARFRVGRSLHIALMARKEFPPIDIVAMRFKARFAGLVVGSIGATLSEKGLRALSGQEVAWDPGTLARDTAMASIHLFAWRNAVAFSDMYNLRAMTTVTPSNLLLKELEMFGFQQAIAATTLGGAMLINRQLFDQGPTNPYAAGGQLGSLLLGMNFGRLAGRRAVLFHRP